MTLLDADATVWLCKKCRKSFYTETQLLDHSGVHVPKHAQGVYQCGMLNDDGSECKYMTDDRNKMNVHRKEMHES